MRSRQIIPVIQLLGLAALLSSVAEAGAPKRPEPVMPAGALPVPIHAQATTYSCGAAVMASLFYYWQVYDGTEADLYGILETSPDEGTHPRKMTEGARIFGLQAEMRTGMTVEDLRVAVQSGATVVLDIQAWPTEDRSHLPWEELWEDGHYVVLVAMDATYAYVMDPSVRSGYGTIPLEELPARWHDYETRYGKREVNEHLGIIVRGTNPIPRFPAPLVPVE